ncbi:ABC transporter ATP-binding protein [Suttonella sp. R2A3]|uniref:ABC transporter ATP-binding protein n=1 Tax=Suttonella sp. R2A3 TaxID=2908648 RepID=UPI001F2CFD26|nr:ABC transporter ATP-binding protein [Suttonella sp. R2A3]UJF24437.1 ABC transporter ATP-binding protein [Suttonella sp. R2A3]
MSEMALAIDVRGLSKHFAGKTAVDDVSIAQPKGSVWGFLGPNGSGKTTCIRMICGLLEADRGEGQCLGFDIRHESRAIKNHTGYMTQHFSFWTDLSVRENLEFVARLYGLARPRQAVDQAIEDLGLTQRQYELTAGLSGGWKQRLALAAVTLHQPKLLLLDEPTAGVDPQARREFWQEIHAFSQRGMTVLVSTHYMDEAERCDHIVYLAHGRLLTQGSVAEIIHHSGLAGRSTQVGGGQRGAVAALQRLDEVDSALFYGGRLHVVGQDAARLDAALAAFSEDFTWQVEAPTLDDAFIALEMQSGGDQR